MSYIYKSLRKLIISAIILVILGAGLGLFFYTRDNKSIHVTTKLYGQYDITEPVLVDLFKSKALQRLKHIRQYGVIWYCYKPDEYTRYDHSVSVFALLRKYNCSLDEQIAGLLHDASHTIFSHVTDFLYKQADAVDSYQDDIHEWFLTQMGIDDILDRHGMSMVCTRHKSGDFVGLEQPSPNLCADRLEYNLTGGVLENKLTPTDVQLLLEHIRFDQGQWYFTDKAYAAQFGRVTLYLTENMWSAPFLLVLNIWAAQAIKRALEIKLITQDDIHFGIDEEMWQRLSTSQDQIIVKIMQKLHNRDNYYRVTSADKDYDLHIRTKFRGVNPLVAQTDGSRVLLTDIDEQYSQEYHDVKDRIGQGSYIKWLEPEQDRA